MDFWKERGNKFLGIFYDTFLPFLKCLGAYLEISITYFIAVTRKGSMDIHITCWNSLIEVELTGGEYTWEKSKGTSSWVRERLDRCFANDSWWSKFSLSTLTVFHVIVSDHDPIKLDLLNTSISKKNFRFRFENTWLKKPNFHSEISKYWQYLPAMHFPPKLVEISKYMAQWCREFF